MKKIIFVGLFICISNLLLAQSLYNWQSFYKKHYYYYNCPNYLCAHGDEEYILIDKVTFNITRVPFPADFKNLNYHNNRYYDSASQSYENCQTWTKQGPNNSLILTDLYGCHPDNYMFDGLSYSLVSSYAGLNIADKFFLPFHGGVNYFGSSEQKKFYQYDGTSLVVYDSTNSPIDDFSNSYFFSNQNDNVVVYSDFKISVLANNTWTYFDTSNFNFPYLLGNAKDLGATKFAFIQYADTVINIYNIQNSTWQSVSIPSSMNHCSAGPFFNSLKFDNNNNIWVMGDSIFCKYDGSNFYDYFNLLNGIQGEKSSIFHICDVNSSTWMVKTTASEFMFNTNTNLVVTPPIDEFAKFENSNIYPTLKDGSGNVWFGVFGWGIQNGLIKVTPNGDWHTIDLASHFLDGAVRCIKKDTGSAVIVGIGDLSSQGLIKIQDTTISILNDTVNHFSKTVNDLAFDSNHHIWYGGDGAGINAGLTEYANGVNTTHYNSVGDDVSSVEVDNNGAKWIAYFNNIGLVKYYNGSWTYFNTQNSILPNDTINRIVKDPFSNDMWFCTEEGFVKFDGVTWSVLTMSNSGLPSNEAENVYFHSDSSVWYSTRGGISILKNSTWETYTPYNSPLRNSDVESLLIDDSCNVWIATEFGVNKVGYNCGNIPGTRFIGRVYQDNQNAAQMTLINIFKLNSGNTDVELISNTMTDSLGRFEFVTKQPGDYYFQAVTSSQHYSDHVTSYSDNAFIIQNAIPFSNLNTEDSVKIHLQKKEKYTGNCKIKGHFYAENATIRTGNIRIVLVKNNLPVESVLTDAEGNFLFTSISNDTFELWVDKLGFNNSVNTAKVVGCADVYLTLHDNHIEAVPNFVSSPNGDTWHIYPNPTKGILTIENGEQNNNLHRLELSDMMGNVKFHSVLNAPRESVDISMLPEGIYFLRIDNVVWKVIKQN